MSADPNHTGSNSRQPYTVFISSTYVDNKKRRNIVRDAITMAGMVWHGMEIFTAGTRPTVEECRRLAGEADVLVGIVAWRWGRILTAIDRPIGVRELWAPTIIAIFFNQVLPSTFGGDGLRVWLLTRMERPLGLAVRSVLVDRILGMLALMVLSGLGALSLLPFVSTTAPLWGAAAVSLTGAAGIVAAPNFLHMF